jgi:hypothetical protein
MKRSGAQLAKRYDDPKPPPGFLPAEWEALRSAHAQGLVGYSIPGRNGNAVWSMNQAGQWMAVGELGQTPPATIAGAPVGHALALEAGCVRCGEELDKAARGETCSACRRELAAKARLADLEYRDHRPRVDVPYLQVVEVSP